MGHTVLYLAEFLWCWIKHHLQEPGNWSQSKLSTTLGWPGFAIIEIKTTTLDGMTNAYLSLLRTREITQTSLCTNTFLHSMLRVDALAQNRLKNHKRSKCGITES